MRILTAFCLVGALAGCRMNPRRDVGRVQAPIGQGQTEIFPRAELQSGTGGMLAGPVQGVPAFPVATSAPAPAVAPAPQIAQGPLPGQGASVPFSPPQENMPMAAITPPPIQPPPVPVAPVAPTPIAVAPAAPAVAVVAPASPTIAPIVQAIPVVFPSPTTGSSFIPAGAVVPLASTGIVVPATPGVVGAQPALNQLVPTAPPAPGLTNAPTAPSFLSRDAASLNALRLQPQGINAPTSPSPPPTVRPNPAPVQPLPTQPQSTPTQPAPTPSAPLVVPPPDGLELPPLGP